MRSHQEPAELMQTRFALQTVGEYGQRLFNGRRAKIFEAGRPPRFGGQSLAVERPEAPGPIVAERRARRRRDFRRRGRISSNGPSLSANRPERFRSRGLHRRRSRQVLIDGGALPSLYPIPSASSRRRRRVRTLRCTLPARVQPALANEGSPRDFSSTNRCRRRRPHSCRRADRAAAALTRWPMPC